MATPTDLRHQELSPETSASPRGGQQAERSAREAGDSVLALGTSPEIRWHGVDGLSETFRFRIAQSKCDADVVLRADVCHRISLTAVATTRSRLSLPGAMLARSTWDLSTSDSVVSIPLTPELLSHHDGVHDPETLVLVVVSLAPRRSVGTPWALSFTLALDGGMLCHAAAALLVETLLCDQDGVSAGIAHVEIRIRGSDSRTAVTAVSHSKQAKDVRISPKQLKCVAEQKPSEVVVEISVTGQETSRTFRSQPWRLNSGDAHRVECVDPVVLRVDDVCTQAIRFVVYQHSAKERAQRLAEGLVTVAEAARQGEQPLSVELNATEPLSRKRRALKTTRSCIRWGELAVICNLDTKTRMTSEPLAMAATLMGDSGYTAALGDVRGTPVAYIVDATIEASAAEMFDHSLAIHMKVTPGKWSAKLSGSTSEQQGTRVDFHGERHTVDLQWTPKERTIPGLDFSLFLSQSTSSQREGRSRRINSKSERSAGIDEPVTMTGSQTVQLPVLFAYPDDWISVRLPIVMESDESTVVTLRVRLRFVVLSLSSTLPEAIKETTMNAGLLSISTIKASGALLKSIRPLEKYAIVAHWGDTTRDTSQHHSVCVCDSPLVSCNILSWTESLHYRFQRSTTPPLIVLQLLKFTADAGVSESLEDAIRKGTLVGALSMPLPQIVLRDQHLVAFELPLSTADNKLSGRKCGTLSFEMQWMPTSTPRVVGIAKTVLKLQRILWSEIPPALAVQVATRRLKLMCEVAVLGGCSLNEELWKHETQAFEALKDVSSGSSEYVANHSVWVSDLALGKLNSVGTKGVMTLKFLCGDPGTYGLVLVQAVIQMRQGWHVFSKSEKDKWHTLYGQTHSKSNPVAVGQVQLSVCNAEDAARDEAGDHTDGWLVLQVQEAACGVNTPTGSNEKQQAYVEVVRTTRRKTQKSSPKWGSGGIWRWDPAAVFDFPISSSDIEKDHEESISVTLVVDGDCRLLIKDRIDLRSYVTKVDSSTACIASEGSVDDWIFATERNAHARVRFSYVRAMSGSLHINVDQFEALCYAAHSLPVSRLALRWIVPGSPNVTSTSAEVPTGSAPWKCYQFLAGITMQVPIGTTALPLSGVPTAKLQVVGFLTETSEVPLAESSIRMTDLALVDCAKAPEWIVFHTRDNTTRPAAVALIRFRFPERHHSHAEIQQGGSSHFFSSHAAWRHACSSALVLWKKLFYRLDANKNGRVDIAEFKGLFGDHTEVFQESPDGDLLLRILSATNVSIDGSIEKLFADMDRNGDKSIEWAEFVGLLQTKLRDLQPEAVSERHETTSHSKPTQTGRPDVESGELRRKRREDQIAITRDKLDIGDSRPSISNRRSTVKWIQAPNRNESSERYGAREVVLTDDNAKLQSSLQSTIALLELEKQKSAKLEEELRRLRFATHQLEMQQERFVLEQQTKTRFVEEAIRSHEHALQARAEARLQQTMASIVLQSKVRGRLEQKKFQALKLQRWSAAVRIQCAYRTAVSRRQLDKLREQERKRRQRMAAATMLQRFLRYHLRRQERVLLTRARHVSATLLQKYARRMLAIRLRSRHVTAAITLQCWHRGRSAVHEAARLRYASAHLRHWLRGCVCRRRWLVVWRCVRRVQRWWRRTNMERWDYFTKLESAVCIQAAWRGKRARLKWRALETSPVAGVIEGDTPAATDDETLLPSMEGLADKRSGQTAELTDRSLALIEFMVKLEDDQQHCDKRRPQETSGTDEADGAVSVADVGGDESAPLHLDAEALADGGSRAVLHPGVNAVEGIPRCEQPNCEQHSSVSEIEIKQCIDISEEGLGGEGCADRDHFSADGSVSTTIAEQHGHVSGWAGIIVPDRNIPGESSDDELTDLAARTLQDMVDAVEFDMNTNHQDPQGLRGAKESCCSSEPLDADDAADVSNKRITNEVGALTTTLVSIVESTAYEEALVMSCAQSPLSSEDTACVTMLITHMIDTLEASVGPEVTDHRKVPLIREAHAVQINKVKMADADSDSTTSLQSPTNTAELSDAIAEQNFGAEYRGARNTISLNEDDGRSALYIQNDSEPRADSDTVSAPDSDREDTAKAPLEDEVHCATRAPILVNGALDGDSIATPSTRFNNTESRRMDFVENHPEDELEEDRGNTPTNDETKLADHAKTSLDHNEKQTLHTVPIDDHAFGGTEPQNGLSYETASNLHDGCDRPTVAMTFEHLENDTTVRDTDCALTPLHVAREVRVSAIMRSGTSESGEASEDQGGEPEEAAGSARSDDLMLLDAMAVAEFREDVIHRANSEEDESEISVLPTERDDSDASLLLDLEQLSGAAPKPVQTQETSVVVPGLD